MIDELKPKATTESNEWSLVCDQCGRHFDLAPLVFGCPACADAGVIGTLEMHFRLRRTHSRPVSRVALRGLGRYLDVLPGGYAADWISLGEGGTPLLHSRVVGPALGLDRLYFKNETANPTWSFKDRYVVVTINIARYFGYRRVVVTSTGNLGVSVAAYCAVAGMDCLFIAPRETARPILDQARLHGAFVIVTTRANRQRLFEHVARMEDWFPVGLFLRRPVQNPFGVEGYKSIAYEINEDLGAVPAAVLFPCARGNGLYGAWKGFCEAHNWGWAKSRPQMIACQPVGGNSLQVALDSGLEHTPELKPVDSIAISANETVSDDHALAAIRDSGGAAISARDDEIIQATGQLGLEGLCVEPSSALPLACLPQLLERKAIPADEPVICVLTASGMRWSNQVRLAESDVFEIDNDVAALDRYLAEHCRKPVS